MWASMQKGTFVCVFFGNFGGDFILVDWQF